MMRPPVVLFACAISCAWWSCNPAWKGFDPLDKGWYYRLDRLGDCEGKADTSAYYLFEFEVKGVQAGQTSGLFEVYSGRFPATEPNDPSKRLYDLLRAMDCGAQITVGMPLADYNAQWLSGFHSMPDLNGNDDIYLKANLLRVFTEQSFREYLQSAAQQGELEEHIAIELALMNASDSLEQHGKLYIQRHEHGMGDSVSTGREVHIRYHTFLLNGIQLDSITEMVFPFGKPGQLIPGLQYGLSFMQEGDSATIFMPSFLAFGEGGSSTGIVPPFTPVYFEVKVLNVLAENE
ncbi:MAG: FKBP-type peptidyl-prolyl cis-trans isomerase [Flavobacteriales bacterium]|jgi:FKBP-type peptidyl-prolyl cis-trans isomerase